jgi:O-antigen ligase
MLVVMETQGNREISQPARAYGRRAMIIISYTIFGLMSLELQFLSVGINIGNLILISALAVLALLSISKNMPFEVSLKMRFHDCVFILYIAYILTSAAWSVSYGDSIFGAAIVLTLLLISILVSRVEVEIVIKSVLMFAMFAAAISILMMLLVPDIAYQPKSSTGVDELRGVFKHQLRLGAFMSIAACFIVLAVLNGSIKVVFFKRWAFIVLGMILILTVLYLSRTRLYAVAALLSLMLTIGLSRQGLLRWATYAFIGYGSLVVWYTYQGLLEYLERIGFDTSLTARTLIWSRTLGAINEQNYWFGYGYDSFVNSQFDYLFPGEYRPAHAHNSFLQAQFETGAVGLSILIVLICSQFLSIAGAKRCTGHRYSYALFLLIFNLLGSMVGLNYAGALSLMFGLFIICLAIETRSKMTRV